MSEAEESWYQLGFGVARSLRYHAKRRAFFERCDHLTRAITAIAGFGTVGSVLNGFHVAAIVAGSIVGVMTALDLVFDYSRRASVYDGLYRRFADLGVRVAGAVHSDANYRTFDVERLLIEKEEPTKLSVLDVLCANEELKARDFGYSHKVTLLQRSFCEILDLPPLTFDRVEHS